MFEGTQVPNPPCSCHSALAQALDRADHQFESSGAAMPEAEEFTMKRILVA